MSPSCTKQFPMAVTSAMRPVVAPALRGVRLSAIQYRVFLEPPYQVVSAQHLQVAVDLLRSYGREVDVADLATWRGNSFTSMSDGLLADLDGPLPELDFVLLAYQTPDLHVADVAGCYLADRCPGDPVAFSVSEQGPGAVFTALRVADAMYRFGDLREGALFVYDQTGEVWDAEPGMRAAAYDSAAMVRLGGSGEVAVESVTEQVVDDPYRELAAAMAERLDALVVVGTTLALAGRPPTGQRVVLAPADHACTSAWVAVSWLWPLAEPVLVADYDPRTARLYTCTLVPAR